MFGSLIDQFVNSSAGRLTHRAKGSPWFASTCPFWTLYGCFGCLGLVGLVLITIQAEQERQRRINGAKSRKSAQRRSAGRGGVVWKSVQVRGFYRINIYIIPPIDISGVFFRVIDCCKLEKGCVFAQSRDLRGCIRIDLLGGGYLLCKVNNSCCKGIPRSERVVLAQV